jgi:hypothetical protein
MNALSGIATGFTTGLVTGFKAADSRVSSLISTAWNAAPHIVRAPLSAVAGVALSAIAKVGAGFDYVGIPATSLVATHKVAIITGFKVVGAIAATYAIVKIAQVCLNLAGKALTAASKGLTSAREAIEARIYKEKDQEITNLKAALHEAGDLNGYNAANEARNAAIAERDAANAERDAAIGERNAAIRERNAVNRLHDIATRERDAASQLLNSARAALEIEGDKLEAVRAVLTPIAG